MSLPTLDCATLEPLCGAFGGLIYYWPRADRRVFVLSAGGCYEEGRHGPIEVCGLCEDYELMRYRLPQGRIPRIASVEPMVERPLVLGPIVGGHIDARDGRYVQPKRVQHLTPLWYAAVPEHKRAHLPLITRPTLSVLAPGEV